MRGGLPCLCSDGQEGGSGKGLSVQQENQNPPSRPREQGTHQILKINMYTHPCAADPRRSVCPWSASVISKGCVVVM